MELHLQWSVFLNEQRCNYVPVATRENPQARAASLDAVVSKQFQTWDATFIPPTTTVVLLTAACVALGAVFVFVSLSPVAQGHCGEQNHSPQQTEGINT